MRRPIALLAALLLSAISAPIAIADTIVGAQFRYWDFSNANDMRNPIIYVNQGPLHLQLEAWEFDRGQDQLRPEVGLTLKDSRRSAYTVQWRHERDAERFWLMTEQTVGSRLVLRGGISPIVGDEETLVVYEAGADLYFGSYSFAGATAVRDPRGDDRWVFPMRMRLATESNDWLQLTVAPASEGTLGWGLEAKWRAIRAGVERNNRFDFTDLDNTIYTVGLERTFRGGPSFR